MDINETLKHLRETYLKASLDIKDCSGNPFDQFNHWLKDAISADCDEPNAFTLSTIHQSKPRARVVLLKGVESSRFVFYTNYLSSKGHELKSQPYAAMTFLWLPLQRQVRIEGTVSKVEEAISDSYFRVRPRGSQIGAIASPQSQKVNSRQELEEMFKKTEEMFQGLDTIPRPPHWGGYAINPHYIEFWQGRQNRMHDRIFYELKNGQWELGRLAP